MPLPIGRTGRIPRLYLQLFLSVLATAFFVSAEPARAAPPEACSRMPAQLSGADLDWFRFRLKHLFPSRYAEILSDIAIREADEDMLVGPQFRPAQQAEIILPQQFLPRLCRMIVVQVLYDPDRQRLFAPIEPLARSCVEEGGFEPQCLDLAIQDFFARVPIFGEATFYTDGDVPTMLTYQVATFLLAHEAGHAVLRATLTPDEFMEVDEETEADMLALMATVDSMTAPVAPTFALASASLVEQPVDPRFGTHPSAFCRYRRVGTLVGSVIDGLRTLSSLSRGQGDQRSGTSARESWRDVRSLLPAAPAVNCEEISEERFAPLTRDLDDVAAIVRQAGVAPFADEKAEAAIAALQQFSARTQQGRGMADTAALNLLLHMQSTQSAMGNEDLGQPASEADKARVADRVLTLFSPDEMEEFGSGDRFLISWLRAMTNFARKSTDTPFAEAIAELQEDLDLAFSYADPVEWLQANAYGLTRVLSQSPSDLEQATIAVLTYTSTQLVIGDCSDEAMRANLMSRRTYSVVGQVAPIMSVEQCQTARREFGRLLAQNNGYVFEP